MLLLSELHLPPLISLLLIHACVFLVDMFDDVENGHWHWHCMADEAQILQRIFIVTELMLCILSSQTRLLGPSLKLISLLLIHACVFLVDMFDDVENGHWHWHCKLC
jgi:hypothetical protein